ncbi:DUF2789 domain-containing protein [Polynucleobacter sp. AP-Nickl1-40-C4]|nr:DUF2789 domain-containing protein [Polynucleobacter sp. AP-Nickl1-40-C4]MEA9569113.1 DUF2789 domain-containing protein [Polynucleobacter sp. AP-Nickl1-40-C4]
MDATFHPLKELFRQLGLESDTADINRFIAMHAPLNPLVSIADASFWTTSQKEFLKDELLNDADWSEAIDLLNSQLRIIR